MTDETMTDEIATTTQPDVLRVFQSKEETKAFYDKIARVYDLLAERSEQPMREAGRRRLDAQLGERILEIGFGTGHNLDNLARAVGPEGKVFGVDISEKMCEAAQRRLSKAGLADRVALECGDAEHLPYGAETMDGILMNFVLELFDIPNIPAVLGECRRVLRSGERLVVVAISKEGRQGALIHAFEWTHRHLPNLMDCRPIYVRRAMEEAGFRIDDATVERMWVPVEIVLGRKT